MHLRKNRTQSTQECAMGLLARREHSAYELTTKLLLRGHSADNIYTTIQKLQEKDFQNNNRFAESLIHRRATSGYGRNYILSDLQQHNINLKTTESLSELLQSYDWIDLAVKSLQKKFAHTFAHEFVQENENHIPTKIQQKIIQYLLRRGFSHDESKSALIQFKQV